MIWGKTDIDCGPKPGEMGLCERNPGPHARRPRRHSAQQFLCSVPWEGSLCSILGQGTGETARALQGPGGSKWGKVQSDCKASYSAQVPSLRKKVDRGQRELGNIPEASAFCVFQIFPVFPPKHTDTNNSFVAIHLTISGPLVLNRGGRKKVILRSAHRKFTRQSQVASGQWAVL